VVVGLSAPEGSEFRVQVQDYSGPLDLFVYLVKQEELDLLAVSVLRIVKALPSSSPTNPRASTLLARQCC